MAARHPRVLVPFSIGDFRLSVAAAQSLPAAAGGGRTVTTPPSNVVVSETGPPLADSAATRHGGQALGRRYIPVQPKRVLVLILCLCGLGRAAHAADWHQELLAPAPAFSQMPLWFWNDELSDEEIVRQMADFRAHGVYGFTIHPRMGLPKSIPYLGERWMHHVRVAVEEAARTGMYVCLYDEAMYPSGSAHGEVVRSNPAFAAQGLLMIEEQVAGPRKFEPRPTPEGKLIATVLARRVEKKLDYSSCQLVDPRKESIDIPAGSFSVMRFAQVPSEGRIRGVHPGEDDRQPDAPAAADLLSGEAMKTFLRLGYEPYAAAVGEHFGKTIVGMFTDEPGMLGRGGRRGLVPWTTGFEEYFAKHRKYDLLSHLPALFSKTDEAGQSVREDFATTLAERLDETYYRQLSEWCAAHSIALTGHPSGSDEIWPLRRFHIPGQDIVWRWLLPNNGSALEGVNSTVGKCSSSVAFHEERPRNSMEIYGAYGWHLTMEEMKWLADWMFVRGVDCFYPHAFYYSVRENRFQERPPDLGPHNAWWPHYRLFADYITRMSGLVSGNRQVCDVAVLSVKNHLPWRAAQWLFQHQIDFNYLEDWRLVERSRFEQKRLLTGPAAYTTLIVDQNEPLEKELQASVDRFASSGGRVVVWNAAGPPVADFAAAQVKAAMDTPDLRCREMRKDGVGLFLLTNEGENAIDTTISCRGKGRAEWFDAWTGRFTPARVVEQTDSRLTVEMKLGRRESLVLCVDPRQPASPVPSRVPTSPAGAREVSVEGKWMITNTDGKTVEGSLGDWRQSTSAHDFAGTLRYAITFARPEVTASSRVVLDAGKVGDWAVVRLNGQELGPRFWAAYAWDITDALQDGKNELILEVTNSLANRLDTKNARPSGLFGPVVLNIKPRDD